jgi:hypothetical protein
MTDSRRTWLRISEFWEQNIEYSPFFGMPSSGDQPHPYPALTPVLMRFYRLLVPHALVSLQHRLVKVDATGGADDARHSCNS